MRTEASPSLQFAGTFSPPLYAPLSGTTKGLQLRSLIKKSGELELALAEVPIPEPGPDQVVVKVEATPINPSDLGLLMRSSQAAVQALRAAPAGPRSEGSY